MNSLFRVALGLPSDKSTHPQTACPQEDVEMTLRYYFYYYLSLQTVTTVTIDATITTIVVLNPFACPREDGTTTLREQ